MSRVDVAFLIADLSGYTALTEAMGDLEAAKIIGRYVEIAHAALEVGTRLVERVGDELLLAAPDAASVLRTAVRLRAAVDCEPLFPSVRAGMHAGPALEHDARYLGGALNLTARVAGHARAGQILCTRSIAVAAVEVPAVECREVESVRFKNIADPVVIYEVLAPRGCAESLVLDPVCRMQVPPDTAAGRLVIAGRTYYFCSLECVRAFASRPEQYALA